MRGRLRITDLMMDEFKIPEYGEDSPFFTIKITHGGKFDATMTNYVGGKTEYFDMCSIHDFTFSEFCAMLAEIGLSLVQNELWLLIPENEPPDGLHPVENSKDLNDLVNLVEYSHYQVLYSTTRRVAAGLDFGDFSFTQYEDDERIKRIEDIRDEMEHVTATINKDQNQDEFDNVHFHDDYYNLDSSDIEENSMLTARKRGRYSKQYPNGPQGAVQKETKDNFHMLNKCPKGKAKLIEVENTIYEEEFESGSEHENTDEDESSDSIYNSNDERMAVSSCDEADPQYPEFNENTDMDDPHFELGMLFSSGAVFRAAVRKHAIINQRGVRLKKNLTNRIKWICTKGCEWKCYGLQQQRSKTFQIKTLYNKHTCNPTWEQKQVNSTWIATHYEDDIRMNPTWPIEAFQAKVVNDLKCNISHSMIYRALRKAKDKILGNHESEFAKLFDYANEIKRAMPDSTVKLMTEPAAPGFEGRRFKRFYVCLGPLKDGFIHGCRPLIGLDGTFLKGSFGGILLTAVGTDPNDGVYPIAWAQVEAENNSSWD